MSFPLVYCLMVQNRLHEVLHCIKLVEPYVDQIVVVEGGSSDESLLWLRNLASENAKLHVFLHPWKDNFSEQRTNYLKRAREVVGHDDFYCLVSDPDEWFSTEALENLRDIAGYLEQSGLNMAMFQCRSVTVKGEKRVWENLDNYWKGLFFKYQEGIHYTGNPHETLVMPKSGLRPIQTPFLYEHVKQENAIWLRGARNSFVNGGGPNLSGKNLHWVELKNIVRAIYGRDLSWHEYEAVLVAGNLDQRIKEWMFRMKGETGWDGASEMREHYKTYFRHFHPEEEPEEFRGVHIE